MSGTSSPSLNTSTAQMISIVARLRARGDYAPAARWWGRCAPRRRSYRAAPKNFAMKSACSTVQQKQSVRRVPAEAWACVLTKGLLRTCLGGERRRSARPGRTCPQRQGMGSKSTMSLTAEVPKRNQQTPADPVDQVPPDRPGCRRRARAATCRPCVLGVAVSPSRKRGVKVPEDLPVGRGRRMVELVDDDVVEVLAERTGRGGVFAAEGLNGGKERSTSRSRLVRDTYRRPCRAARPARCPSPGSRISSR